MAIVTGTTWTHATANSQTYASNIREDVEDVITAVRKVLRYYQR